MQLTRIASPTGYLLCFFPAAYGALLASSGFEIYYISLFFIGSILVRSAGCILNDLADRDFDKYVERTRNRPLAAGKVTVREALLLLFILLLMSLMLLVQLPSMSILLGFIAVLMIAFYPFAKRFTYYPQIILGFTFNMGCLIGYSAVNNQLSIYAFILYFGCVCWTVAFDSIYAFMDIKDDKKTGIKSLAIILEPMPYKAVLFLLYVIFLISFSLAFSAKLGVYSLVCIIAAFILVCWMLGTLNINNPQNCLLRFKVNNIIGTLLFFSILLEKL